MQTLRRFIRYYKPYKFMLLFDLFCATVVSGVDLTIPLIINQLLRGVFLMEDKSAMFSIVLWISLIFLALYLIRMLAQYYVTSWGHIMGAKMESDMRRDLFEHLEKLSFSYYDKNNTGKMMSRIISDLFDIAEFAHHGPEDIFISIAKLLGSFFILVNLNPTVSLALLGVTLVMILFSAYYNRKMKAVFMDNRKKIAEVNAVVQDSLSGIRVVKSFTNEHLEWEKFSRGNEMFYRSKKRSYLTMGKYFSLNGFMQGLMYVTVILVGGFFVHKGIMDGTDVVMYILYIGIFLDPINRLVNFTEQFQKGYTGFQRMLEILDTEPEIVDSPNAKDAGVLKGQIVFDDVTFGYDENTVLENVNVTINAGTTVAIVGPSGSGKTTFCSLIPRFYDVVNGKITIDGMDIRDMTLSSLRQNIGIVQQDVYIFNSTIRENIAYGRPGATEEEIIQAAKQANIHDFIMTLDAGYDTETGERGVQFSGGQKQRISIARAFLKNPPILILDEATSALDNESDRIIQQSLDELSKDRTTIIIAHRLSTVKKANEIIVLTENGVEEKGTHDELMKKNRIYANLYNLQFRDL